MGPFRFIDNNLRSSQIFLFIGLTTGWPCSELNSYAWMRSTSLIKRASPSANEMLLNGDYPKTSNIMTMPTLAATFRSVAEHGLDGFYKGRIAEEIVKLVKSGGGVMELSDLEEHTAEVVEPIKYEYRKGTEGSDGVTLWEVSHSILLDSEVSLFERTSLFLL